MVGGACCEDSHSGEKLTPEQGFQTGFRTRWAFRRRFDARAGVSYALAAKVGLRAPFWRPSEGFVPTCREKAPTGASDNKKDPVETGPFSMQCALTYWMRVRQYGHTFQSALSGRWHVGQTFLTCVLQMGHTTKSRSMGAPHLGQMP